MKLTRLTSILAIGLVLAFAATGCKTKTTKTTPLDQSSTGQPGPGSSGTLKPEGSDKPSELGGLPFGSGHPGWPENPDILKAETVHFAFDSAVIRPQEQSKVAAVADYLKSNGANALKIAGHCDERGTEEYNRALGERRALALREELARLGVDATRVDTISFGKDKPAVQGHDESAWSQNRRGEFIVLTPPR